MAHPSPSGLTAVQLGDNMLDRTLLHVVVKESSHDRRYWADRPFAADQKEVIRAADVILVPWEEFREGIPAIFPEGTTDFAAKLRGALSSDVAVAVNRDAYQEIALHSRTRRLATLLVTAVALPSVAGALGNIISDLVKNELWSRTNGQATPSSCGWWWKASGADASRSNTKGRLREPWTPYSARRSAAYPQQEIL